MELQVLKRIEMPKSMLDENGDSSDQTQFKAAIKAYLVVLRMVKHHYLATLIVFADCYLELLFKITWSLPPSSGDHFQGCID